MITATSLPQHHCYSVIAAKSKLRHDYCNIIAATSLLRHDHCGISTAAALLQHSYYNIIAAICSLQHKHCDIITAVRWHCIDMFTNLEEASDHLALASHLSMLKGGALRRSGLSFLSSQLSS